MPSPEAFVKSKIDMRHIDCIVNFQGNVGKTLLGQYLSNKGLAIQVPCMTDYQDIMAFIIAKQPALAYMVDMPRALDKKKLSEVYSSLETLKDGYCYDKRYTFKERRQNPPLLFVFTNSIPNYSYLSADRWRFWTVRDDELVSLNHVIHSVDHDLLNAPAIKDSAKTEHLYSLLDIAERKKIQHEYLAADFAGLPQDLRVEDLVRRI